MLSNYNLESKYINSIKKVIEKGFKSNDRTNAGVKRLDHIYINWKGFALLRYKKINIESIIVEALWILKGYTSNKFLVDNKCNYWNYWSNSKNNFGPIYGHQVRSFNDSEETNYGVDQLRDCINQIKYNSDSRRIIISLWNPITLNKQVLPPCHILYQFTVYTDPEGVKTLNMFITQRSADGFIGVPYDMSLFSIIHHIIALYTNCKLGNTHYTCNDFHIYNNHIESVEEYLKEFNIKENRQKYYFKQKNKSIFKKEFEQEINILKKDKDFTIDNMLDIIIDKYKFKIFNFSEYIHGKQISAKIAI